MLWVLLSKRWFQGGIVFCVVCVVGSLLYSWHVDYVTAREMARHDRFLQERREKQNETRPVKAENGNGTAERVETPTEQAANIATDTETPEFTSDPVSVDAINAFIPDGVATAEPPAEEVPVSPFGFGPYPEVPADYPLRTPVWIQNPNLKTVPDHAQRPFELMDRVLIQLWNQGHKDITGASFRNGIVYPHHKNTAYVRYHQMKLPDGSVHRTISKIIGGPDIAPFYKQIRDGNIPLHIKILDLDTSGIDPLTFLNEEK